MKKIKLIDGLFIVLSLIFLFSSYYFVYFKNSYNKDELHVYIDAPGKEYIYPLKTDRDLNIDGYLGVAFIRIRDSKVDVLKDPSPRQICVNQKPISDINEFLICLPNRISIFIKEKNKDTIDKFQVDAIVY